MKPPYKGASLNTISQTYHKGHKALDMVIQGWNPMKRGFGFPLTAPEKATVIGIRGDNVTPDRTAGQKRGYSIWLKGHETGFTHFFHHTQPVFPVNIGDEVEAGQIVAFMGNSGSVYSSGVYVPLEDRLEKPKKGTHLHYELYKREYVLGGPKMFLNPLQYINWTDQPSPSILAQLKAYSVTLGKIAGLLKKV